MIGRAHLCELSDDAVALPAAIADEGLYGVLAEDEVLMRADLHADVCRSQNVNPPRPWEILGDHHTFCPVLVVHLRKVKANWA